MIISHNLQAMNAQRQFNVIGSEKKKSTEKLSSGYKINRAADDAAGLTISEKMRSLIRGLDQGSNNIQDGISLVQIADGALAEVNDMLHRMTELSVKSANGTNTDADRIAIQNEIEQLVTEIDRISQSTEFNTMPILGDAFGVEDPTIISQFVTSPSAEKGFLGEAYPYNGRYFPAASLDYSNINESNINNLYGNGFSFVCGHGCGETFSFKFVDGDGTQTKRNSGSSYTVDIHGMTSGSEVVNEILSAATNSQYNTNALPGVQQIAHKQGIVADGNKLWIIDTLYEGGTNMTGAGYSSEADAKDCYPDASPTPTAGSIDASSIVKELVNELVNEFPIQCSNNKDDIITIKTKRMDSKTLGISKLNVSTQVGASNALSTIEAAGLKVSAQRSELGAYQNRLEHAYDNNQNKLENTTAAESRIRDTDMASEMVNYTKNNILEQAVTSMLSQANQSPQNVLSLLQ